jgi:hypothetical protein
VLSTTTGDAMTGPIERAGELYERAVFGGDAGALALADAELDGVEADLALARGRVLHARFLAAERDARTEDPREGPLFERAAALYRERGNRRGEAEALFWVGCYRQVVRGDSDGALPALERSYELARSEQDKLTMSYAVRHLGFADLAAGRLDAARSRLAESVRLRREIDFRPGVAAGLVALAHVAIETGDRDAALDLLAEAESVARGCGAHGVLRWVDQARATT